MTEVSRRFFLAAGAGALAAGSALRAGVVRTAAADTPPKFDLDRFIEAVRKARQDGSGQQAVHEVLARAVAEPGAILRELGEPRQAGIHTLHRAPDLTILNVVWAPLMVLLPHDHRMWASIGIYSGREDNITWGRQSGVIEAAGAVSLSEKEVFDLDGTAIHSVINPIRRMTGALHIYGGDFFGVPRSEWDAEALTERPMDMEGLKKSFDEGARRFDAVH